MVNVNDYKVSLEKLRNNCNCDEELEFVNKLQDIYQLKGVIGQERAVKSMDFGLSMKAKGYNIFVVGPQGTGKSTYTKTVVSKKAAQKSVPEDWCYINNFNEKEKPLAVSLEAGQGKIFQKDMEKLISNLTIEIKRAFEDKEYENKKDLILQEFNKKMNSFMQDIEKVSIEAGFNVEQSQQRIILIPIKDGKAMEPEEYNSLPDGEREKIEKKRNELGKIIEEKLREVKSLQREIDDEGVELQKQTAFLVAKPFINKLKNKYNKIPKIIEYLDMVLKDVSENYLIFKSIGDISNNGNVSIIKNEMMEDEDNESLENIISMPKDMMDPFIRYKVNLFVNNENRKGAPVVIESNPYYYNLFGKIEYKTNSQSMATTTDFTMIKAGAIQRANGGYLILQAKDLFMDQFSWDALKKALKYNYSVVENIGEQNRFVPTVTLKPESIPLNVKIILIGSPEYYYILSTDEDFRKQFKVKVDFDTEMIRNQENIQNYVYFVNSLCQQENLISFNKSALAKVVEFGSRLADNQNKLSTQFNSVSEIVYESSAIAEEERVDFVDEIHVEEAIKNKKYRLNMLEEKLQEQILDKKVLIDTEGSVVGQVNGLSVMQITGYSFGMPSRITARTYMGKEGVINIERETEMSGNIHSKGVLTLNGYLGGKLAQEKPLGLTAQVTFEQLYGGVEGDSASSAELYAILSSLSGVPLKQSLAVTGSVNQMGEIQPIGGVNEKIEGFFDICKAMGLNKEQGVIIPKSNIDNLMLKDEVIEAVKNNLFNIFAVKTIEEGISILSGISAGEVDEYGNYPEGSIFYLADHKLHDYTKGLELAEEV
ncbi:Lon protease family protein [Sedimentibacter sp. MB31-C6]|uniref:Lon protease family protein n=1 Tax=Sedimentibacter sp. MB31-C6 TaxID=3109366 RepID=UPI002DDCAD3B|nr:AAA family ATPase [Sedimentibacter sp. MB36-C1]WSI04001.1 AAA family ATPase [Sedimentibacter sp. MB36-C1]